MHRIQALVCCLLMEDVEMRAWNFLPVLLLLHILDVILSHQKQSSLLRQAGVNYFDY